MMEMLALPYEFAVPGQLAVFTDLVCDGDGDTAGGSVDGGETEAVVPATRQREWRSGWGTVRRAAQVVWETEMET
jgi:hypothetical protein